jgi:hypothetical protein
MNFLSISNLVSRGGRARRRSIIEKNGLFFNKNRQNWPLKINPTRPGRNVFFVFNMLLTSRFFCPLSSTKTPKSDFCVNGKSKPRTDRQRERQECKYADTQKKRTTDTQTKLTKAYVEKHEVLLFGFCFFRFFVVVFISKRKNYEK